MYPYPSLLHASKLLFKTKIKKKKESREKTSKIINTLRFTFTNLNRKQTDTNNLTYAKT